ncbi:MAG: alpha/beta hydrolase [Gammaproteobacteria bacterium]|nr:alpha/beta hydrolase [Gammaproteobacteria bacterium]
MPAGPESQARESLRERAVAAFLRFLLKALLQPGFRATRPIEQQRRWLEKVSRLTLAPKGAIFAPGTSGGVPGEWVAPRQGGPDGRKVLLYLHGGAYCVGSPRTHRAITGHLALRCRSRVFALDYRLAPEHPFPAAIEDGVAAYRGLLDAGHEPHDIAIAGDSAGGGLALATALKLRELGRPFPAALVAFSPWVDLAPRAGCGVPRGETMIEPAWLDVSAGHYLAGRDPAEPLASPVRADLAGLPATLVQVGTDEVLLSDSERLYERLRAAGVDARLTVYPRRWHVFQSGAGVLRDADRALDEVAGFLRDRVRS